MTLNVGHQSPGSTLPPFAGKTLNTALWGDSGTANTLVITDPYIRSNSVVYVYVTGSTPANGRWSYTVSSGSLTITSSDAESSTLPIAYIVL